ncbi:MAG: hypothetical protein ACRDFQ_09995 [Anaerolineales bacterium]
MSLTVREFVTAMHGMIFGALFLLAFSGGLAELFGLRKGQLTPAGLNSRVLRLKWGTTLMAIASWATVISRTWVVYPWYRATPPEGET